MLIKPNKIISNHTGVLFIIAMLLITNSFANSSDNVPHDLKQWEAWVLKDKPAIQCPVTYNRNTNLCAYPNSLLIDMKNKSGHFEQVWVVYAKSWINLPGDNQIWPKNVHVNQKLRPVISRNDKPSVELDEGRYNISGDFSWQQRPESLSIPEQTGLINLTIDNKVIISPDFRNGKLWLKNTDIKSHQNNKLDIQVFRKISDTIPLRMTTHLKLNVSGQQREITLEGALLDGFKASAINSRLPSQINKKGRLKIQIRPGQWSIEVSSFNQQLLKAISLPALTDPWPDNELWVLDQRPHLRLIKVIDKNSIDPNQTQLPQQWKAFPAYSMQSGEQIVFDVLKRGDPEPEPDQLSLTKKIWLDFNGDGFTVNDRITGKLSREWRLNALDVSLGQVTLNGKPQFITENDAHQQGVEVRHGNVDLSADSRIEDAPRTFSASGWDMDFTKVTASLYLPAGWKLMSLSGANANGTWLKKWTLLDLFIVLITAIAIYKIFGLKWGVISLLTLTLVWHEYGSPQYIWCNLIIAVALLKVLPEGRFYKLVRNYRIITSIFLVLIILPFIVNQVRTALYPQLEFSNRSASTAQFKQNRVPVVSADEVGAPMRMAQQKLEKKFMSLSEEDSVFPETRSNGLSSYSDRYKSKQLASIDPDAMIQTGPGLPSWTLHQYYISWDGPVRKDQNISMILLSPKMNSVFKVLQMIFILLLAWRLLDTPSLKFPKLPTGAISKSTMSVFLLTTLFGMMPLPSEASFPSDKLLDELQKELTKPAQCLPQCASIESMSIDLSAQQLNLSLRIHAQEEVIFPLPIPIKQWIPEKISVDGKHASGLIRNDNSTLWLHSTKGSHLVKISGRVDHLNQLQFSFPLKPHYISLDVKGWTSEGMDKEPHKITAVNFLRIIDKSKTTNIRELVQSEIAVYAEVSRSLELGLDWHITTHVKGVSGSAYPVILNIPLLDGESVLTDNIKVKDNHAIITLNSQQRSASWTSRLKVKNQVKMHASEQEQFIEKWTLDSSPVWHIEYQGTPVIYHQRQGNNWRPEWHPWPGEDITINVSRPKGVAGRTVTIDSSTLTLTPGEQITSAKLVFNLRSSLGGQHVIHLPLKAELQTVKINDQNMPIRITDEGLSLPVSPGQQTIEIEWREPRGISSIFNSSFINLGIDSVNNVINIKPGYSRWVLFTSGPTIGPAVLFWGMLIVILIIAYGLGRIKDTPLNSLQWVLLGFGLSASGPWGLVLIAGCIFALRFRGKLKTSELTNSTFNAMQMGLVILVFVSVSALLAVIQQGLLGSPDMQITGNGSNAYQLNWFSDRIVEVAPEATMISVPVNAYRLMMLAWSIWLAFAIIKWAQWGWGNYTHMEYWRNGPMIKSKKDKPVVDTDKVDKDNGWHK